MPFKKVNVKDEINKRLENDAELKKLMTVHNLSMKCLSSLLK